MARGHTDAEKADLKRIGAVIRIRKDEHPEIKGNVTELARQLKTSRSHIGKWINGNIEPNVASARALARVLGGEATDYRLPRDGSASDLEIRLEQVEEDLRQLWRIVRPQRRKRPSGQR